MAFVLFFLLLTCLWSTVLHGETKDTIDTAITSLFLTIFELTYAPLFTSYFLNSLNVFLISGISVGVPVFFVLIFKKSNLPEIPGRFFTDLFSLKDRYFHLVKSSTFLKFLNVCLIIIITYLFIFITFVNRFGWDGEAYHSPAAAWYNQNNRITRLPDHIMPEVNTYPKNIELFSMMIFKLNRSDRYLESYQLLFFLIASAVLYKIVFYFLKDRRLAVIGSLAALFHSVIIKQMVTTYLDAAFVFLFAFALYFLIRGLSDAFSWPTVILLALSLGYIAQTKGSGLHVLAVTAPASACLIFFRRGVSERLSKFTVFSVLIFLSGGLWWVKNYFVYSNPFHPFAVNLGPFSFAGRPSLGLNIYNIDLSLYRGVKIVSLYLDFFVDISLLFLIFGYALIPFFSLKTFIEKRYIAMLMYALPLVIFACIPFSWIPRYGLILTIPSAIAFAWFIGWTDRNYDGRILKKAVYSVAVIALIIQIGDALPSIHKDEWTGVFGTSSDGDKKQGHLFKNRFDFFRNLNAVIGIEQIRPYEDDPHWYKYWGPGWKNKIVIVQNKEDLKRVDFFVYPVGSSVFKKEYLDKNMDYVLTDTLKEPVLKTIVYRRRAGEKQKKVPDHPSL